jgi:hypothetical protein
MGDTNELWGTFAVDDHLRKRAFVAEIVLFDRLVIPVPPEDNDAQFQDWKRQGWRPKQLSDIVKRLEDLVVPLPWSEQLRAEWQGSYDEQFPHRRTERRFRLARQVGFDFEQIRRARADSPSRHLTRAVLRNALNQKSDELLYQHMRRLNLDPAAEVEVVLGYGSYPDFQRDLPLKFGRSRSNQKLDSNLLVRWNFLVPNDSGLPDAKLLSKAIKLSRKSEFRESRREFHSWRRKLLKKGVSVEKATTEMEYCLKVYTDIMRKRKGRNAVRTALQFMAVTVPLADFVVDHLGSVSAVAFGIGSILADKWLPEPAVGTREKFTALVYDSRKAFGWKDR